jgi:transposase
MALADSAGLPLAVSIADGSRHDVALVEQTLDAAFVEELPEKLIADRGFDSAKLADQLSERDIELVSPIREGTTKRRKSTRRKQDGRTLRRYKKRWKVERLFAWLKQFRRINTRWDRKAENFLGFLYLGCMVILLRAHF